MVIALLVLLACQDGFEIPTGHPASSLGITVPEAQGMIGRGYHRLTLEALATTSWTHVEVCGPVVYARRQRDGDWHVTLDNGRAKVVAEFLPGWTRLLPKKGQIIRVRGIVRIDRFHQWAEVHPVEGYERVTGCASKDSP